MAGLNGLRALFSGKQIQNVVEGFKKEADDKTLLALQLVGERFVNKARLTGNYTDQTGNLRSSIGYIILNDGKVVESNFSGNETGRSNARATTQNVASIYPKGLVLIGVAGMEYAAYVEAKEYDVITGSAPGSNAIRDIFNEI